MAQGFELFMEEAPEEAKAYGGMVMQTVLYDGLGADGMSRGLEWYLGTADIDFEAGLASESAMTSQAHSVVLLRLKDGADVEAAKAKIAESIDPFKWICVGVDPDKVRVESNGDLICVVLDEENGDYYADNFLSFAVAE